MNLEYGFMATADNKFMYATTDISGYVPFTVELKQTRDGIIGYYYLFIDIYYKPSANYNFTLKITQNNNIVYTTSVNELIYAESSDSMWNEYEMRNISSNFTLTEPFSITCTHLAGTSTMQIDVPSTISNVEPQEALDDISDVLFASDDNKIIGYTANSVYLGHYSDTSVAISASTDNGSCVITGNELEECVIDGITYYISWDGNNLGINKNWDNRTGYLSLSTCGIALNDYLDNYLAEYDGTGNLDNPLPYLVSLESQNDYMFTSDYLIDKAIYVKESEDDDWSTAQISRRLYVNDSGDWTLGYDIDLKNNTNNEWE